jgi:predicted Co/Zn/Cd cation transporter (cation efflux family)
MDGTRYEQRSLTTGMWANLLMGVSGVTAAQLSNSDALMVDGLYSGVNFVSAIIAGKIAASVRRKPDQKYPFGYEANESLYVLFRSLVLLGILAFAAFSSINKIVTYARGGQVPELNFGPITIYMFFMIAICFGLAAWHGYNWRKTGKRSEILKTERTASIVDGFISAGAGGALLAVTFLKGTPLDVIIPVADAIVVLVLATVMIGQPAGMLRSSIREVAGRAVDDESTTSQVRERIEAVLAPLPGELLQVAVTKLGRFHFVVSYIKPTGSVTAIDLDTLRGELHESYADLFSQVRSEIVFTAEAPYD